MQKCVNEKKRRFTCTYALGRREEDIPWQLLLEGSLHLILDQHIVSPCLRQAVVLPGMKMNNKSVYKIILYVQSASLHPTNFIGNIFICSLAHQ
jgi:hypothetical protein